MRHNLISGRVFLRFAVALAVLPLSLASTPAWASDADEIPFNTNKILEFHNTERAARGIGGLSRDPRMDAHAQEVANRIAARGVLEHSPAVARSLGYAAGGQNLVMRSPSINASQANYMWMTSSNHRKNLLNPGFTHVGIGIACSTASGRVFPVAVVDFGGTGLSAEVPPQDPVAVPAGALQGHALVCDGSAAPASAAPQPAPPAPAPAPAPAPVAAPVAPKPPAAPKAVAPPVVAAPPAPAPAAAAPPPASIEIAGATPSPAPTPADPVKPLVQAGAAADLDRNLAGWSAFIGGVFGAIVLAAVAGGFWYRSKLVPAGGGKPSMGRR